MPKGSGFGEKKPNKIICRSEGCLQAYTGIKYSKWLVNTLTENISLVR